MRRIENLWEPRTLLPAESPPTRSIILFESLDFSQPHFKRHLHDEQGLKQKQKGGSPTLLSSLVVLGNATHDDSRDHEMRSLTHGDFAMRRGSVLDLDLEPFALFSSLPLLCFGISNNMLLDRIPADRAFESNGDIGQMAGGHRAVMGHHI